MRDTAFPWEAAPAPGEAVAVADGVLWAALPLPRRMKGLGAVNLYALEDGDGWTLIDAGLDWPEGRAALAALIDGALAGRPVRRVILTHHHPDHVGLAGWLAARGAGLAASRVAWLYARMLTLDARERPAPDQVGFRQRHGMTGAALEAFAATRPFNFADVVGAMPPAFAALDEGDSLEIGGRVWTVRLGEGHAPAHVTLWSGDGLMIAGDQVLPGISPNIGVWPTEPESDPLAGFLESCRRFAALGGDPLVLPGHRLPFRGLAGRLAQLLENHESALDRVEAALAARPARTVALFDTLYRREIDEGEFGLALAEAVAHLNHLHRAGRVTRRMGGEGAWLWQAAR